MKRFIICLFSLFCIGSFCLPVYATEQESFIEENLEQWGDDLEEVIPKEAEEFLDGLDLQTLDLQQLLSLDPQDFFTVLQKELSKQWEEPVVVFAQIMGILLLSAMLNPLQDSLLKGQSAEPFHFASMLCLAVIFAEPVSTCIYSAMLALKHCSLFLLTLIPILAAVLVVGGQAVTASAYQLILFAVCQLISQLAVSTAVPLLGIYFSLSIIFSLFPNLGAHGLVGSIKNLICWGLGIVTTLFVGLLSLQTFITSNVDVVTLKTSRFLMGSFIPVVGSILSEAFSAAQGCVSLLRSTVGTFGVVVTVCSMLPILIRVVSWYLVLWLSVQLGQLLDVRSPTLLLKSASNTFAILLAVLSCFLLLILVATTLVIFIGTGG